MITNKILGYSLSGVGVIIILLSFSQIQKALKITFPSFLTTNVLTILGVIILAVGSFVLIKTSSKGKLTEVPIYHGEKVVGYRRIHNN
ncbi:MAG: hypothetical protein Q7R87_00965 [Nanoarchaeota archaeon]|nr:hypothetical protein [Nanoarchaeota archaeon]